MSENVRFEAPISAQNEVEAPTKRPSEGLHSTREPTESPKKNRMAHGAIETPRDVSSSHYLVVTFKTAEAVPLVPELSTARTLTEYVVLVFNPVITP